MKTIYGDGGRMYEKGGKVITGQDTSTVRTEKGQDGSTKEFVGYDERGGESVMMDAPEGDWARSGAIKVDGNWNEYAAGQDNQGNMFIADDSFPIMRQEDGSFMRDEQSDEDSISGREGRMKAMDVAAPPMGGQGESPMEDLLERLGGMPSTPMQFGEGGTMPSELLNYFKNKK